MSYSFGPSQIQSPFSGLADSIYSPGMTQGAASGLVNNIGDAFNPYESAKAGMGRGVAMNPSMAVADQGTAAAMQQYAPISQRFADQGQNSQYQLQRDVNNANYGLAGAQNLFARSAAANNPSFPIAAMNQQLTQQQRMMSIFQPILSAVMGSLMQPQQGY